MKLKDRVVLVTGAGRGIGRATAKLFGREGAKVMVCSRTESELVGLVKELKEDGCEVFSEILDISDFEKVFEFVERGQKQFGPVDVLVNNASILGPKVPLTEYPLKDWEEVITVNLTALFYITKCVLSRMVDRRSGCIINFTSSVGRTGRALWGGYSVSKFGVEGLTQVLAEELEPYGVYVMALNPGGTRTRMRAEAYPNEDPRQLPEPEKIARVVLHLALSAGPDTSGRSYNAREILPKLETGNAG